MSLSPLGSLPNFDSPTLMDLDVGNLQEGQRIGGNSRGRYRQLVRFYKKKVRVPKVLTSTINPKTGEETNQKYAVDEAEKEFVEIITPGDKNIVDDFAQPFHKRDHFLQYKAFREGRGIAIGKPVEECDYIPSSLMMELRVLGVQTQEQLADASDHLCNLIASGWELREHARAICKLDLENQNLSQVNALKAELETSKSVIAEMQAQLNEMKGLLLDSSGNPVEMGKVSKRK